MASAALTRQALEHAGTAFECRPYPRLTHARQVASPYSSVTRMEMDCGGATKVVYLKQVKAEGIGADAARKRALTEYDRLVSLFAHFAGHKHFAVPRPIAVFPEECAILTEEIPGMQLMGLIGTCAKRYKFRRGQSELQKHCFLAGAWLKEFQSFTTCGSAPFDIDRLRRYCEVRLDTLQQYRRTGVDAEFKRRFAEYLMRKHEESGARLHAISGRHNDFSPHNILVDRGRVGVIDFGFFDYDSALYDVCRFWFQLEQLKSSPLFRSSTIEQLQRSFFEGYGTVIDSRDAAFEMIVSRYFITRLVTMAKEGMRRGLANWVDRRSYRWCLAWLDQRCNGHKRAAA